MNDTIREEQTDWNALMKTNIFLPYNPNWQRASAQYTSTQRVYVKVASIKGIPGSGTITVNITGYGTPTNNSYKTRYTQRFYYQIGDGDLVLANDTIYGSSDTTATFDVPAERGKEITIYVRNQDDSYDGRFALMSFSATGPTAGQVLLSKYGDISGKATKLNSIGQPGFIAFFGSFGGKFVNGISDIQECIDLFKNPTTTTEATVGSITPGNFVGYIVIGDFKIPYYK